MNAFYLINLLVYAAVDAMACLGLSQQFGVAGVTNFGFIIFQAAGGYAAAILALPGDHANGGFQSYIGGWDLPFPLPWIGAAVVGSRGELDGTARQGRHVAGTEVCEGNQMTHAGAASLCQVMDGGMGLSPMRMIRDARSSVSMMLVRLGPLAMT